MMQSEVVLLMVEQLLQEENPIPDLDARIIERWKDAATGILREASRAEHRHKEATRPPVRETIYEWRRQKEEEERAEQERLAPARLKRELNGRVKLAQEALSISPAVAATAAIEADIPDGVDRKDPVVRDHQIDCWADRIEYLGKWYAVYIEQYERGLEDAGA